ncbi:MAG TPA: hypothetical protein VFE23_05495 [Usitatibacter sp.]|jgi:hypothetical protein|nr:hypothetical protein [Usitatibacter sp.]
MTKNEEFPNPTAGRIARLVLALMAICPFAHGAGIAAGQEPAAALYSPGALVWMPRIEYRSATLRVAGPGGFVRDIDFGTARPAFPVDGLADGTYTYEVSFGRVPDAELAQALASGARGDDGSAPPGVRARIDALRATVSGTFVVSGGRIVSPDLAEPATRAAAKAVNGSAPVAATNATAVLAGDQSVQGSLCVGLDCTASESFGFDTLRLKENNTRITFLDDSTSPGFPNNVWTLTANDAASGGANKFSIDDVTNARTPFTVTAGAPTNSFFMASTGKVGFGTNAPGLTVHLEAGDTPALRMEQDATGGFTPQTWDIGANEANWFVRDTTGGSRLPLRIRPGAPTSSIDIAASGSVGIGTASPNLGGVARALTVATPNAANGTSEFAALELSGGQSSDIAFGVVRFYNKGHVLAQVAGAREGADDMASLRFNTGNAFAVTEKMRIMPSGFVGIGTSAPAARLHVQGDAIITGNLQVQGACCGPDYVFDGSYNLASIDEQARYMREHHHLPALAAARTTDDGRAVIDVFQQSNGMLEELEKAHLYIDRLHREIEALKAESAARDRELAAIKARLGL